jgi:hypothetical protein
VDVEMLSESELDVRLRRGDPVNRAAFDDERVRAQLDALRRSVMEGVVLESASLRTAPRYVGRQRWATLGAAVAAVVIASLVGLGTLTGGGDGGAGLPIAVSPAAAAQLNVLARAAAGQAMPTAHQWEYLAVKVVNTATVQAGNPTGQGTNSVGYPTVGYRDATIQENWIAPDGRVRQRDVGDGFSFLTPKARATYLAHRRAFKATYIGEGPMIKGVIEDRLYPAPRQATKPPAWMAMRSSDPQGLVNAIWRHFLANNGEVVASQTWSRAAESNPASAVQHQWPWDLWQDLTSILLNSTSAVQRSTAYRALAYVPHARVLGTRSDQLGRSGLGISMPYSGPGEEMVLIASPSSGDLLEEDWIATRPVDDLPAGTITTREIFLQRGVVDSDTALTGGGSQPFHYVPPPGRR